MWHKGSEPSLVTRMGFRWRRESPKAGRLRRKTISACWVSVGGGEAAAETSDWRERAPPAQSVANCRCGSSARPGEQPTPTTANPGLCLVLARLLLGCGFLLRHGALSTYPRSAKGLYVAPAAGLWVCGQSRATAVALVLGCGFLPWHGALSTYPRSAKGLYVAPAAGLWVCGQSRACHEKARRWAGLLCVLLDSGSERKCPLRRQLRYVRGAGVQDQAGVAG